MKRYYTKVFGETVESSMGEWVRYSDAETEIERARRERYTVIMRCSNKMHGGARVKWVGDELVTGSPINDVESCPLCLEEARADERERMARDFEAWVLRIGLGTGPCLSIRDVTERIRRNPAQEPKPLRFDPSDPFATVQDLVDRVNELSKK